ncbi:Hypothetical predicted protein [Pelobates cultripes]|uniref:L1 transposable element RRM domain-containing protein n=1 Tax=Pelobates cultripes TaxID=61616 RepID=A0AAD1SMG0_PELCU|nr:Hypothetical predicted protein [Pelobates cultripes]CAH2305951.1 Hypothetical predicted protein [Pelobates cultripes]
MADDRTSAQPPDTQEPSLSDIRADIRALTGAMVTKADLQALSATLHEAIRSEVATIQRDIVAQDGRIQTLEATQLTASSRLDATDAAVTRQGNMLLQLRRQTEDLDNRGRRSNIRIRNLPEAAGEEDVQATLTALFREILGPDSPPRIDLDRAHRALRPRNADNTPRDVICCLHEYRVKEMIMNKARLKPTWRFQGAEVALYQDLSPLTLEARRALRPVTQLLRSRNIPYKWGFPFCLLARHNNEWRPLRWPDEVPAFLQGMGLPRTEVTDWILNPLEQRPNQPAPRAPRRRREDSPLRRPDRRPLNPAQHPVQPGD